MIHHFFILLLCLSKCSSDNTELVAQNRLKIVQAGDSVNFACIFSEESRNIVWVKQRVGEKPLPIVSSYQALPAVFENGFDKHKRFFVAKDKSSFNLSITNAEESDTGTYYCIKYIYISFYFGEGTDLIVKDGQLSMDSEHQRPETDPDHPEESAAGLQCVVVTQSCAGEHNVYWFRHESGESPPGIIYTQERRNAVCERRSDGNSTTHKCVYNLPKKNLSHYDAGIYYCAVATCGEILFGEGRKVDLPGTDTWSTIALVLAASNCLSVIVIIILGAQLYKHRRKDGTQNIQNSHLMDEDRDALNYAALSFQQKPSTSRRPRGKHIR
ncbi:immunoglobulin kappa light chain-like isoform X2 [Siphateles boraxobius]|uniref:immunoglobulin kappa light chain-like isoform X2 n=1 Tax=Siphateles boraxobius TaxID=180520 RepID=UPI0040648DB4